MSTCIAIRPTHGVAEDVSRLMGAADEPVLRRLLQEFVLAARDEFGPRIIFASLDPNDPSWPLTCELDNNGLSLILSLRNILREWQQEIKDDINRQKVIKRWVSLMAEHAQGAPPEAGPESLLPTIKHVAEIYIMRLSVYINHRMVVNIPHKCIAGDLAVVLVKDMPAGVALCSDAELDEMNLKDFDAALSIALTNLKTKHASSAGKFEPLDDSNREILVSRFIDSYASSRLLLPEVLEQIALEGDSRLILVPDRDNVIVASATNEAEMEKACELMSTIMESAEKPISSAVFQWSKTEKAIQVFQVPESMKRLKKAAQNEAKLRLARLYHVQRELLEKFNQIKERTVANANLTLFEEGETGNVRCFSTWTRGVASALPKADYVVFNETQNGKVSRSHRALFENALRAVPDLIRPIDGADSEWLSPSFLPRFATEATTWPSTEQFKAMDAEQIL